MRIRRALPADALAWERLRYALWPGDDETHGEVTSAFFQGDLADPAEVLLAESPEDGGLLGFVELSVRFDIPGTAGERTGYVEGLYVVPVARAQGVALRLLRAAEQWARDRGCTRFGSDREDRVVLDRRFKP